MEEAKHNMMHQTGVKHEEGKGETYSIEKQEELHNIKPVKPAPDAIAQMAKQNIEEPEHREVPPAENKEDLINVNDFKTDEELEREELAKLAAVGEENPVAKPDQQRKDYYPQKMQAQALESQAIQTQAIQRQPANEYKSTIETSLPTQVAEKTVAVKKPNK